MKTLRHTIAAIVLSMISIASFGATLSSDEDFDYEYEYGAKKFLSKELTVNKYTVLNVKNTHGNIRIVPWNQPKATIEVFVENIMDIKDMNKMLEINISENGNVISAVTKHLKRNVKYRTNYVIHVPMSVETILNNKFGDIYIDGDMTSFCNLEVQFGNIFARNLLYKNAEKANVVNISNGNATLASTTWLNTKVSYGSLKLDDCHAIGINANFANVGAKTAKFVNLSASFSNIGINSVDNIKGKMQHSDLKISNLKTNMSLTANFGDIRVYSISKTFSKIDLLTEFTGGSLTFEKNSEFVIDGKGSFTGFDFFNIGDNSETEGDRFKRYVGKNTQKQVKITAKFGSWQIMRD